MPEPEKSLYCLNYVKVAYTLSGHKQAMMARMRCKRWTCPYCREKNARIWYMYLKERLPRVSPIWYLMTLTAHENTRTTAQSLANVRTHIEALIKRLKRVFGEGVEYVRVYEKHPTSDAMHAHFIISGVTDYVQRGASIKHKLVQIGVTSRGKYGCWSVKSWLKHQARDLQMGYMADIRIISGGVENPVKYVTKYLFKDQGLDIPYLRHIQTTRGIGSPKSERDTTSEKIWRIAPYITPYMFDPNTQVTDLDTGEIIDNNYWETKGFYPDDLPGYTSGQ